MKSYSGVRFAPQLMVDVSDALIEGGQRTMANEDKDPLTRLVNASGFAFQIGLEHQITQSRDQHRWVVMSREHGSGNLRLVLECKRPRDGTWMFLVPGEAVKEENRVRVCGRWEGQGRSHGPVGMISVSCLHRRRQVSVQFGAAGKRMVPS